MKKQTIKRYGITALFLFIGVVVLKYYIDKEKLGTDHRFTIGVVYSYRSLSTHGYTLYYKFESQGKTYESDNIVYSKPISFLNKRFYVKFSPKDPKNCELLIDKPVQDTLLIRPQEGWESIPE
jgi:hypothetical protein